MGRYINFEDVRARYSVTMDEGPYSVESTYIYYAEHELDSLLGQHFATPFSSDNVTAKDLAIDLTYLRVSNFKVTERKEFKDMIMTKIDRLINGDEAMVTTSGSLQQTAGGTVYSSSAEYEPVFTLLDETEQFVDRDQVEDERRERDIYEW